VTDVAGRAPTLLVLSRSLGSLLGFDALAFKLEAGQPTGSWLDRDAVLIVGQARQASATGLCLVGPSPLTPALAVQCARAGLRLVTLRPTGGEDVAVPGLDGWLAALGVRQIAVEESSAALRQAAPTIADRAGLWLVTSDACTVSAGLAAVADEIAATGHGESLLAVPALTRCEPVTLAALAGRRTHAVPLPLEAPATGKAARLPPPFGVVGHFLPAVDLATDDRTAVVSIAVTVREADAARALLAREEGLIASRLGAAGLAAVIRAVRDDRARRPREQRLPRRPAAVVVVTGDPFGSGDGPPRASDTVPSRTVLLAELLAAPGRLLVEPPTSGAMIP
jgi:threonine synthase